MSYPLLLTSYLVLWTLVMILVGTVFLLYWHHGNKFRKLSEERDRQGPALNKAVAPYSVLDVRQREVRLGHSAGAFQIIFFGLPATADSDYLDELANWIERSKGSVETVLIIASEARRDQYYTLPAEIVVVPDPEMKVYRKWNVVQPAFALLIDNQGVVRLKGLVSSPSTLRWLYGRCGIPEVP